jgi:hypothetical protein
MKRSFLVLICISLCLTLYASDIYKSNELGQKLDSVKSIGTEGYYLEVSATTSTLYFNDSACLTITTEHDSNFKTITKKYSSGEIETYVYENNLLKTVNKNGTTLVYNYIDNKLAFCVVNDGEIFFLRSKEDGNLIAIKRGSEIELLSDAYLYQDGSFYNILSNSIVLTGDFETLEDGTFKVVDEGKTYHYSEKGLLLSIESEEEKVQYNYVEAKISTIKTTYKNNSFKVESYDNGTLIKVEQFSETGVLTTLDDYSTGKLIRTVYKDGRPVADIYYKEDNVSVNRIEYR